MSDQRHLFCDDPIGAPKGQSYGARKIRSKPKKGNGTTLSFEAKLWQVAYKLATMPCLLPIKTMRPTRKIGTRTVFNVLWVPKEAC